MTTKSKRWRLLMASGLGRAATSRHPEARQVNLHSPVTACNQRRSGTLPLATRRAAPARCLYFHLRNPRELSMPDLETAVSNRLLRVLPPEEMAGLAPLMERRRFELLEVLAEADSHFDSVFFPEDSIISVVRPADGELVEAGTIGREGMAGFSVLFGTTLNASKLTIQHAGEIIVVPFMELHALLPELPVLRDLIGRYILTF